MGDKIISEAYFDEEHQAWAVVVSLLWQGEMKDGCKEIVSDYGPWVTGSISSYFKLENPDIWCIVGTFYADYDDVFASYVIKVLLENGWEWG